MRECERCGAGSWSSRCSGSSIGAVIVASFLRQRHNPRDVQVPFVVARFGHHEAGEIQPASVLDVFGIHVISGAGDLQSELVGGAEETAAAVTDLHVDAEPLAPLAVDLADVDHAGEDRLAVPVALIPLRYRRGSWSGVGLLFLAVELQERAHDLDRKSTRLN